MASDESAEYGGLFSLTCILKEGNITYSSSGSIKAAGKDLEPTFAFASEISDGDYVGISPDTGNTSDATGFLPVVIAAAATTGIIGRVIDEPRWSNAPQASQDTWADMLAGGYYRVAEVEFFNVTAAHGAFVEGTTDVLPGAPLKWDLSLDAWVDDGTTFNSAFCFHAQASATPTECLVGFGVFAAEAGNTDHAGITVIA